MESLQFPASMSYLGPNISKVTNTAFTVSASSCVRFGLKKLILDELDVVVLPGDILCLGFDSKCKPTNSTVAMNPIRQTIAAPY